MYFFGQALILLGFALQIYNLIIDIRLIRSIKRTVTQGKRRVSLINYLVHGMICLFCFVYLIIFLLRIHTIWVGILLFAGAVFVTTVLLWIFLLTKEIRKSAFSITETLIGIVEARDPNLNGHSLHVQELSILIYEHLPQNLRRVIIKENLKYAALFHDVGKLGIPESILNKPAKLSENEWEIMKHHPQIAVKILKPIKSFDLIKDWILYHHEKVDGTGYFKIIGKDIPFEARIISVADTYSAITMQRSYKPGKTHEEAISIIKDVSGTQLDPFLVSIFCKIPKEEVEACMIHVQQKIHHEKEAFNEPLDILSADSSNSSEL